MTTNSNLKIALIIAAAGSSTRMGLGCKKEYLPLDKGTVLSTAAKVFLKAAEINSLIVTIPENGRKDAEKALFADPEIQSLLKDIQVNFVQGGETRQKSVYNALKSIPAGSADLVLIHDGARPFVTEQIIRDTIEAAAKYGAAVPGLTPVDTQKQIDSEGFISQHLLRSSLSAVQTPQGFRYAELLQAHEKCIQDGREYTDDTEIWEKYADRVKIVPGDPKNKKITYSEDYKREKEAMNINIRTGLGYDLHRLVSERKLIIGGVEFPFEKGEDGHSDGDVLLHAITDALLGASGMGDIGSYFPSEEPKWKDANSAELLRTVWNDITAAGWTLVNLDCVLKLEKPKFLNRRQEVIESIAKILSIEPNRVFVKAKTGEKLDSVGAGNAIEAWVSCLLSKA
ncbi:MAG: 2-C-methyl-D-erythritol 4-phosphate cytidylyltransferase [Treponema sp.]|nr:2-C-methyl-D-erythritol 4-phosphate cytidylyltransferase [Treponema sp.]